MPKNNKANRMQPANAKYTSGEFAAQSNAADIEFGQEVAPTAGAVKGTEKGVVQKVQEADQQQ
ncbi:hypothetical protein BBG47_14520 [Paenibacillus sp. KS1]|uniref:hypothetical protein n=1 Tax=Paenibacillus sp. KS1 TaxID=1849249 RepID=UPI0008066B51|nr:hypothetical protein [Paenibacillus sp. KS1]OBY78795.1 hypothetical protein BBG47_14520 [Paenibacillus sp. KS1]